MIVHALRRSIKCLDAVPVADLMIENAYTVIVAVFPRIVRLRRAMSARPLSGRRQGTSL
jgi:hypothetical protein